MKERILILLLAVSMTTVLTGGLFCVDVSATEPNNEAEVLSVEPNDTGVEDLQEETVQEEPVQDVSAEGTSDVVTEEPAADTNEEEDILRKPVYNGITIDGDFSDWESVGKTNISDGSVADLAMVFDGEDIFIYVSEPEGSYWPVAQCAGVTADGKFVITSDTGKQSIFYLRTDNIKNRDNVVIDGSSVRYDESTRRYELRLPASFVSEYNSTITLGYYEGRELIVGVANLQGHSSSQRDVNTGETIGTEEDEENTEEFTGFADWAGYPHSTIAYSTIDAEGSAAMYVKDTTLYIHEITRNSVDHSEYAGNLTPFTLVLNGENKEDFNNQLMIKLISVDASGNTTDNGEADLRAITPGEYTFLVADNTVAWGYANWNMNNDRPSWEPETAHTIYGTARVKVTEAGYEMECNMDLEKLAKVYSAKKNAAFSADDIKKIEAQFGDIGPQWISYAGTSTGPIVGAVVCAVFALFAAYEFCRRKDEDRLVEEAV